MRKVFLTFGDGGENFVLARQRVAREARATGLFDTVYDYDWTACSAEAQSSPLRTAKRGCGYWLWKPDLIWLELQKLEDGDILVWSDSGNVIYPAKRQWEKLFKRLESHAFIFRRISSCGFHWQRKELHEFFAQQINSEPRLRMCYNFEGSAFLVKKSEFSMKLISEWRSIMLKHPELVRDVQEDESNCTLPTFVENRHDQSVLTLLVYKYLSLNNAHHSITSVWEFHLGWWLFGNPAIWVARNRGGSIHKMNIRGRFSRIGYRALWRIQVLLEHYGIQVCWAKKIGLRYH